MVESVNCVRCQRNAPALTEAPLPGPAGEELRSKVCGECWAEWQRMEIMVINELRLDFMDPRSHGILTQHLREFLCLDAGPQPVE